MTPEEQQKELQPTGLGNAPQPEDKPPQPLCVGFTNKNPSPTSETVQDVVGGPVEMIKLADGRQMLVNEEARLQDPLPPVNRAATRYAGREILGHVVILEGSARWT